MCSVLCTFVVQLHYVKVSLNHDMIECILPFRLIVWQLHSIKIRNALIQTHMIHAAFVFINDD